MIEQCHKAIDSCRTLIDALGKKLPVEVIDQINSYVRGQWLWTIDASRYGREIPDFDLSRHGPRQQPDLRASQHSRPERSFR